MFVPYKFTHATRFGDLRTKASALAIAILLFLAFCVRPSQRINFTAKAAQAPKLSTTDFDVIEGFTTGLVLTRKSPVLRHHDMSENMRHKQTTGHTGNIDNLNRSVIPL